MKEKILRWLLARIQKALGEDGLVAEEPDAQEQAEPAESYAAARHRRRIPWRIRRKELEAAARTKRNRREEIRKYL